MFNGVNDIYNEIYLYHFIFYFFYYRLAAAEPALAPTGKDDGALPPLLAPTLAGANISILFPPFFFMERRIFLVLRLT